MSKINNPWVNGLLAIVFFLLSGPQPGYAQMQGLEAGDIVYTLPAGWIAQPVQGAGPSVTAHYVYYQGGIPYCEMYLSRDPLSPSQSLDQAFQQGLEKVKPTLQYYRPLATQKTQIAGREAIVHEFTYVLGGSASFTGRSYVMIANQSIYNFFFNTASNYFPYVSGGFGQIISSVQIKSQPAIPGGLTAGASPVPNLPPQGQSTNRLPTLTPAPPVEQRGEVFRDPAGRFEIAMPPGSEPFRSYDRLVSYKYRENSAYIQIWRYDNLKEAAGMRSYSTKNLELNGKEEIWNIAGNEATVSLHTAADMRPESEATVAVLYPEVNVLMLILLPLKEYEKSLLWIDALIKGFHPLK